MENIDIPKPYLQIEGFDLENPKYTDPLLCENFISEIEKYKDASILDIDKNHPAYSWALYFENYRKAKPYVGALIQRGSIFNIYGANIEEMGENLKNKYPEEHYSIAFSADLKVKKIELLNYKEENPELWEIVENILDRDFSETSLEKLRDTIDALPEDFRCYIRNDSDLAHEFFPRLNMYLKTARILHLHGKKALMKWNIDTAMIVLVSLHQLDKKFFHNYDINLVGNMIGIANLSMEYSLAEEILEESNEEQKNIIKDVYIDELRLDIHEANGWRWEYYFYEHMMTWRGKSIRDISLPFLFDGKDMYARGSLLVYIKALAKANNDRELLTKIEDTLEKYNTSFTDPVERWLLGMPLSQWEQNFPTYILYNPIWRTLNNALLPSLESYHMRIHSLSLYQDYIRHDLLKIED